LIAKVKFCNNLPRIPFDPKLGEIQTDLEKLKAYKPNVVENTSHDLHTEIHMGLQLDLIDQKKYEVPDDSEMLPMHPKDEELLRDDLSTSKYSNRSDKHSKSIPWLRKTEYVVSGFNHSRNDGSIARKSKLLIGNLPNREKQIEIINESFQIPEITSHHTKPDVKPVKIMNLVPDIENWGHSSSLVVFDQDPVTNSENSRDYVNNSLMKLMVDSNTNDQFVCYFLPDENTVKTLKAGKHMHKACYYNLHKDYNWNSKSRDLKGFDQHYCFAERNSTVYYNEISNIIQLGRRKTSAQNGQQQKSTLVVNYIPTSNAELQCQEKKLEVMRPSFKDFSTTTPGPIADGDKESSFRVEDLEKQNFEASSPGESEEEIKDEDIFGSDMDD